MNSIFLIAITLILSIFIGTTLNYREEVISKSVSTPTGTVTALALSGGGYRAMFAATGFLKSIETADSPLQSVSATGIASGSSWIAMPYTFSASMRERIKTEPLDRIFERWLESELTSALVGRGLESDVRSAVLMTLLTNYSLVTNLCGDLVYRRFNWQRVVNDVLNGFDGDIKEVSATSQNRQGQGNSDLVLVTAFTPFGTVVNRGHMVNVSIPGKDMYPLHQIGWVIPEKDSSSPDTWMGSKWFPIEDMEVSRWSSRWLFGCSYREVKPLKLPTPSVAQITAMATAACGGVSAPGAAVTVDWEHKTALNLMGELFPNLAVCTDTPNSDCEFPSMRFIDGGLLEDSSIAMLITHLQKKNPDAPLYRIALLDNGACGPGSVDECDLYNWIPLFSNPRDLSPASKWTYPSPDNTIFREEFILEDRKVSLKNNVGDMVVSHGIYNTVANEMYGVSAGSKVEILALHVRSVLGTCMHTHQYDEYLKMSKDVYTQVTENAEELTEKFGFNFILN